MTSSRKFESNPRYQLPASKSSQLFTEDLLSKFLPSRANGLSPRTISDYEWRLQRFIGYPITPGGIKSFLDSLSCGNGKWNYFKSLRALANWLYRKGYITSNPITFVETPKRQKKLLPAITREQLEVLINHCHCERDKALISFLWHSGTRLSEATNVKAKEFDWQEGTIVVLGKGNRYRKCLAGNGVVREWFAKYDSFGLDTSGIQMMLKRLGKEAGIHCNPHSFRRGFVVHQVKCGLSIRVVQALGGWGQISMVERYTKSLAFNDALKLWRTNTDSSVQG
jgi:site-specific recombinase XerD